ncbi:glutamate formimidoyltransferase [Haloplasma contractile]|uniref:glutamate formimidoyltransferase n=1 Tax=Haloplasma contractile SSD-17B TaxID=1033810 RepID=F7PW22_9MOLU|nr:glutamate formimidoyltransferase [Haloplasma contractile]ERJ12655.1 glutamate formiminotransferase protein [Haloplasma contractile SSD-17B]
MKIVQCVPNFSEGQDLEKVETIVNVLKNRENVKLVSYEPDKDYNRTVVTLLGEPNAVKEAVIDLVAETTKYIDLNQHEGEHSRMGATDVIPFIPIRDMEMEECVKLAKETGKKINELYEIPIFLYEEAASSEARQNLAKIRKGQFEGMKDKIKKEEWHPDYGRPEIHKTAGATAVGARVPLVAYNINLDTDDVRIASKIAKAIRHSGGGFRYIKAGPAEIKEKGIVQVTMNITNYKKTSIYRVFETVKMEAKRYGVNVLGSEIIGLVPMEALVESMEYYLSLEGFDMNKVLETNLFN